MKTIITKDIKLAANLINKGELVAFPTETVYGLGANALNKDAVQKIFKAKGRPSDNPLIVHIAKKDQIKELAKFIPKKAKLLADKFWPGPLTIILKKKTIVPDIVTAGRKTVGIRMPKNKIARQLIKLSKPLAAPSANSFSKPSPTLAKHVKEDLNNKIPLILEGGQCQIGMESTIIDLTNKPTLLRPGKITIKQIENTIGKITLHESIKNPKKQVKDALAPGMKYKHYSPKATVILYKELPKIKKNEVLITYKKTGKYNFKTKSEYAKNIFKLFRELDQKGVKTIYVPEIDNKGIGITIMNRLRKASK